MFSYFKGPAQIKLTTQLNGFSKVRSDYAIGILTIHARHPGSFNAERLDPTFLKKIKCLTGATTDVQNALGFKDGQHFCEDLFRPKRAHENFVFKYEDTSSEKASIKRANTSTPFRRTRVMNITQDVRRTVPHETHVERNLRVDLA
jgi:hypothetical protein